jgi:hypothetical protein
MEYLAGFLTGFFVCLLGLTAVDFTDEDEDGE